LQLQQRRKRRGAGSLQFHTAHILSRGVRGITTEHGKKEHYKSRQKRRPMDHGYGLLKNKPDYNHPNAARLGEAGWAWPERAAGETNLKV